MWFVCSRKILLCLSLMVVLLCCCHVEAIRVFPPSNAETRVDKKVNEDLFHKYFSGRTFVSSNGSQKGFDESKRKVPSCPDPLHN